MFTTPIGMNVRFSALLCCLRPTGEDTYHPQDLLFRSNELPLIGRGHAAKESCKNSVSRFSCRGSHLRQTFINSYNCSMCRQLNDIMRPFGHQFFRLPKCSLDATHRLCLLVSRPWVAFPGLCFLF